MSDKAPFPHCDSSVLHAPGTCEYCDDYPEMQRDRRQQRTNFTGGTNPDWKQCPAEARRDLTIINKWGGNTPKPRDA